MRRNFRWMAAVLGVASMLAPGYVSARAQSDNSAKHDMKQAGRDTKAGAKDAGRGVKKGTKKAYHKTKNTTKGAVNGAKKGAREPQ